MSRLLLKKAHTVPLSTIRNISRYCTAYSGVVAQYYVCKHYGVRRLIKI